jgi:hypothetical protein
MAAKPKPERALISVVFRCCGKHTYGADYLKDVGPFPTECPNCGKRWVGEERYEGDETPSRRRAPDRTTPTP